MPGSRLNVAEKVGGSLCRKGWGVLPYTQAGPLLGSTLYNQLALWGGGRRLGVGFGILSERLKNSDIWNFWACFMTQSTWKQMEKWWGVWVYQNNRWPPAEMFSKQIFYSRHSISSPRAFICVSGSKIINEIGSPALSVDSSYFDFKCLLLVLPSSAFIKWGQF